ncbi:MAG: FkbM family methyltransferase, partial [Sulfitobacter sp.]
MATKAEPVANAVMDAKMREIWASIEKPWVRRILRNSLPPTRAQSMGCDFILHPKDNFTEFRIWEAGVPPEHKATLKIAEVLKGTNPVIVDVGANAGAFFLPILKLAGPKARAVVFEPNPVMQDRLKTNIRINKLTGVKVFTCAVGARESISPLYFPRNGNLGQGRIDLEYKNAVDGDTIDVQIRPLVDCLSEAKIKHVDFLKVDVEGLEDQVICPLLDAETSLWPRLIYFE